MAEFSIRILKKGFEGKDIKTIVAITDIYFDDTDKEVIIPREYEGMPITHVLCHQSHFYYKQILARLLVLIYLYYLITFYH